MADAASIWLARAEQARRVARDVTRTEIAQCLLDYAAECEAIAMTLVPARKRRSFGFKCNWV
jgi:hypothetical protein